MSTTLNTINSCPFCGFNDLEQSTKIQTSINRDKVVTGEFIIWKCKECGEEFFNDWKLTSSSKSDFGI